MSFKPIPLDQRSKYARRAVILVVFVVVAVGGYLIYQFFFSPSSRRWTQYQIFRQSPAFMEEVTLKPGQRCGDAPFAFPTTGVIFGLWSQSYRPGHNHAGLDIFSGTQPGVTAIYAAYPGYLTREPGWLSTIIIRIPDDPLVPGRQIWTYYTHMANTEGTTSFISEQFPPGTLEVFVEAGTFLGRQGTWSGTAGNPTGLHLHFSVVKDDGDGKFLNELDINNTYDPTPYLNMAVNHADNPDEFPICNETITNEDWDLVDEDE